MKLVSGSSDAFIASISRSSRSTWLAMMRSAPSTSPGVATSAPRSKRSFWIASSRSASSPEPAAAIARPMAALASSTSPMAAMRKLDLLTRLPSTSPALPPSPVRV